MNNNKRREKSLRLEKRDKKLLRLEKERRELWNQLREAPLQKLDEPYQKGWERFFTLSEEAKRRKDADDLALALTYVFSYQRSAVNPFVIYRYKSRRWIPWEHNLSGLAPRTMLSQKIPERLFKYFRVKLREEPSRDRIRELIRSGWQGQFYFRYPEYVASVVQPFWITHERVALPEVESRLAEVEAFFKKDENEFRLQYLKDCGYCEWRRLVEQRQASRDAEFIRKEIEQAIIDFERGNASDDWRPVLFLN